MQISVRTLHKILRWFARDLWLPRRAVLCWMKKL